MSSVRSHPRQDRKAFSMLCGCKCFFHSKLCCRLCTGSAIIASCRTHVNSIRWACCLPAYATRVWGGRAQNAGSVNIPLRRPTRAEWSAVERSGADTRLASEQPGDLTLVKHFDQHRMQRQPLVLGFTHSPSRGGAAQTRLHLYVGLWKMLRVCSNKYAQFGKLKNSCVGEV